MAVKVLILLLALSLSLSVAQARTYEGQAVYGDDTDTLWLDGSTLVSVSRDVLAKSYYAENNYEDLEYKDAYFTPFFSGGSCASIDFESNYSTITAFLLTKTKFQKMWSQGTINLTDYQLNSYFWWANKINGSYVFNLNTTEKYAIVLVNTGGQSKSGFLNQSSTRLRISLGIFGSQSPVCNQAKQPGGHITSNDAAQNDANITPYFELSDSITRTQNSSYFTTLTGLSCVSVQIPAQPKASSDLDLTATVMPLAKYLEWFRSNGTNLTWTGAAITQSGSANFRRPISLGISSTASAKPGSTLQISNLQGGQTNIDGLNPKTTYVVVIWNGLNGGGRKEPSTDILLRYAGKTSGTCNSTRFVDVDNDLLNWVAPKASAPAPQPGISQLVNTSAASPAIAPQPSSQNDIQTSSITNTTSIAPTSPEQTSRPDP